MSQQRKARTGHPRKNTERKNRHLLRICRNGLTKTIIVLQAELKQVTQIQVCHKTVNNRLVNAEYKAHRQIWKAKLTQHRHQTCLILFYSQTFIALNLHSYEL